MRAFLGVPVFVSILCLAGMAAAGGEVKIFQGSDAIGRQFISFDKYLVRDFAAQTTTYINQGTETLLPLRVGGYTSDGRFFGSVGEYGNFKGAVYSESGGLTISNRSQSILALKGDYSYEQVGTGNVTSGFELWKGDALVDSLIYRGGSTREYIDLLGSGGYYRKGIQGATFDNSKIYSPAGEIVTINSTGYKQETGTLDDNNRFLFRKEGSGDFYFYDLDLQAFSIAAPSLDELKTGDLVGYGIQVNSSGEMLVRSATYNADFSTENSYFYYSSDTGWLNLAHHYDPSVFSSATSFAFGVDPTLTLAEDGSFGIGLPDRLLAFTKPVPEPSMIFLVGAAGVGAIVKRRRARPNLAA